MHRNNFKIIPSKSGFKWLRSGQKYQNSYPRHVLESRWRLARLLVRFYKLSRPIISFYPIKNRLEMNEIWPKAAKKLAIQVVTSQMAIQIVLIKIQLEMAEIWPKEAKKLATAILGKQVVASQIVLNEQANFLFYPIKIRLEMAEIQSKVTKIASHDNSGRLAGDQLDCQSGCTI